MGLYIHYFIIMIKYRDKEAKENKPKPASPRRMSIKSMNIKKVPQTKNSNLKYIHHCS